MATPASNTAPSQAAGQAQQSPVSTRPTIRKKALPQLVQERRRFREKILDLAWLLKMTAKAAPLETVLFVTAALVSGLTVPVELWATKHLVDTLALRVEGAASGAPGVWLWFGILAGALIVNRIISALEPLYRIKMREVAGHNLEAAAMRKTSRLELIAFENQSFYNQLDRVMQGSYGRGPDVLQHVVGIVGRAPSIIGYTVILAYYAPVLLLISLGTVLTFIAAIWRMGEYSWKLLYEQTHSRRLADYFASALGSRAHVKELRIYGLSQHFLDRWSSLYWQTRNDQRRLAVRQSIHERLLIIVAVGFSMAGLWWVISSGLVAASPGEYAIIFTALLGMWSIADMSMTIKQLGEAAGYAGEFRAFLALPQEEGSRTLLLADRSGEPSGSSAQMESTEPSEPGESNGASEPNRASEPTATFRPFRTPLRNGIRFEDVWFTYPGTERPVLAGVSFDIRAGEKVALVGENGAGKSTLVKLLLGFYRPDHGRITLDGVDIQEIDPTELRRAFSAIFQHSVQYHLKLIDNIVLGDPDRAPDLARVEEAARRSGLTEIIQGLDLGLESQVGPDVGGTELSGGQWQRVALARAFYRQAEILVLDEPTAALDPKAELAVFHRFVELAEDRTAVLISHRMGMARLADRIVVLRDGRVVETGTHDELMEHRDEYAVLFEAQARWYR